MARRRAHPGVSHTTRRGVRTGGSLGGPGSGVRVGEAFQAQVDRVGPTSEVGPAYVSVMKSGEWSSPGFVDI